LYYKYNSELQIVIKQEIKYKFSQFHSLPLSPSLSIFVLSSSIFNHSFSFVLASIQATASIVFLRSIKAKAPCSKFIYGFLRFNNGFLKLNNGYLFNFFNFFNKCDESTTPSFKHGQYDDCEVRQHKLHNMEATNLNGFGNLFTLFITGRTSIDS